MSVDADDTDVINVESDTEPTTYSQIANDLAAELKEAAALTAKIEDLTASRAKNWSAAERLGEQLRPVLNRCPDRTLRLVTGPECGPQFLVEVSIDGNEAVNFFRVELERPWRLDGKFGPVEPMAPTVPTVLDAYLPDAPMHVHSNLCDGWCRHTAGEPEIHAGADAAEFGRRVDEELAAEIARSF